MKDGEKKSFHFDVVVNSRPIIIIIDSVLHCLRVRCEQRPILEKGMFLMGAYFIFLLFFLQRLLSQQFFSSYSLPDTR